MSWYNSSTLGSETNIFVKQIPSDTSELAPGLFIIKILKNQFYFRTFSLWIVFIIKGYKMKNGIITEIELLKYFEGNIDDDSRAYIEKWINLSEENAKIADEVYHIFLASYIYVKSHNINSLEALIKVNKTIKKNKLTHTFVIFQKVAAVLILPLLTTLLYFGLNEKEIEIITVKSTPGVVSYFELPDGTHVTLNSGSTLNYPSKFKGAERNITLEGEAFFQVKKDSKRFIVATRNNIQVEALGTEFNVEAYEKDDFVAVTLASGKIKVNNDNSTNDKQRIIENVGEKIVYDKNTNSSNISSGTLLTDIAWKDGKIVLNNTSLEDFLNLLTKRFDVEFIIKNNELMKERFTGTFDTQFLPKILEHLRLSSGIQYHIIEEVNTPEVISKKMIVELK